VVVDKIGNTASTTIKFFVDTTPPEVTITSEIPEYFNKNTVLLEWTIEENIALNYIAINIDGTGWINIGIVYSYQITLEEGQHVIEIAAVDKAGNKSVKSLFFTIDITPPDITIISPKNGTKITADNITLEWKLTDNIGVKSLQISVNDSIIDLSIDTTEYKIKLKEG